MSTANWCQPGEDPKKTLDCSNLKLSSLCQLGWQPLLITGLLRDILIQHFSTAANFPEVDLRRYVWQDSPKTGILIESVFKYEPEIVEKRPAILIKRNAYQGNRLVHNDLAGLTERNGQETYVYQWVGSHTLFCIQGTDAAAEILSTEVQKHLNNFAPVIRKYLGLDRFAVLEVGAVSELEEAQENYVVPVTVGWAYQDNWSLTPQALPLRRVSISTLLGCNSWQAQVDELQDNTTPLPPQVTGLMKGTKHPPV